MFGSKVLEIGIGLAFVYLLLSLICSTLTELVARFLAMRSRNLQEGIYNLLKDKQYKGLVEEFFKHPLIAKLSKQGMFDKMIAKLSKRVKLGKWIRRDPYPSYISSDIFARALIDIIADKSDTPDKSIKKMIEGLKDNSEIKRLLQSLTRDTKDEFADVKKNIESWFNESMDRVSGWYTSSPSQ